MLTFAELVEKNGIKIPVLSANAGFIGRYKVRKEKEKFQEAEIEYKKLCDKVNYRRREFEFLKKDFEEGWGKTFSVEEEFHLEFSTIEEAIQAIKQEARRLSNPDNSPGRITDQMERKLRKQWIDELIQRAPRNCSLIVIKDKRFHPYHKEKEEGFEKNVSERKEAYIYALSIMCMWAAFDPRKEPNISTWGMRKNESSVKYIIG